MAGRWRLRAVRAAAFAAALVAVPAASSTTLERTRLPFASIGVSDDTAKYAPDGGAAMFAKLRDYGLSSNRISVYWDFTKPTTIAEKQHLDAVVAGAKASGVELVFAIYADPRVPGAATAISQGGAESFCNYAALVARSYPSVTKIIVGNEPNQPRFWRPQFGPNGEPAAARDYEAVLARCYDALKAVNPAIDVIGVGLSSRGNDDPAAPSNSSTSPVRFIEGLADAYRASGRDRPLMDELSFHCYPNVNTDPLQKGYRWPNVGCVNLDRLKQALWDGFQGTAQPTPLEAGSLVSRPLTIVIDETGWQVDVAGHAGYTGSENVPPVDEATQASIYGALVRLALCDPDVSALRFLYLKDAAALEDFQSGLLRVDGSARPAADAVRSAVAGGCDGDTAWRHARLVSGAATESVGGGRPAVVVTAEEDFAYSVTFKKGGRKAQSSGRGKAYYLVRAPVPAGFAGGRATVALRSLANPARSSTYSFVAGVSGSAGASGSPPPAPTAVPTGSITVNGRPFAGGAVDYGSVVDVTNGSLTITTDIGYLTVHGADGLPATFKLLRPQARIVELRLVGGDFSACGRRALARAAKKSKKPIRLVWASGKGKFRTKGRDSTASVHGTSWLTEDRCDGTRTFVEHGVVTVRDLHRKKTVAVRTGQSYLALHR